MQIINITDKKQLNDFVGSQSRAQFLQSWQWGEFQKQVSGAVWRLGVAEDDGQLVASAKLVKKQLPMGRSYFYCGRGPVIVENSKLKVESILNFLFKEIERIAKQESVMFLRFEPVFNFELSTLNFQLV